MDPDLVFSVCNNGVLVFWALLALAPRWSGTQWLVHSALIPALFGTVYLVSIWVGFLGGGAPEGAGFFSLPAVMAFFTQPEAALAGWVHYLVFDLFIGAWEVRDAQRRGIPHLAVLPCLFFTLMLGPVGLLAYLALRAVLRRTVRLDETADLADAS